MKRVTQSGKGKQRSRQRRNLCQNHLQYGLQNQLRLRHMPVSLVEKTYGALASRREALVLNLGVQQLG